MTKKNKYTAPEITISGIGEAITDYTAACDNILRLFCEKHEYGYGHPDTYWPDDYCGCAMIGDYAVDLQTMIDDLKMDAPEEEFIRWYDYCLEAHDLGITSPNFRSWVKGCPRVPEERLQRLRDLRGALNSEIESIKREF